MVDGLHILFLKRWVASHSKSVATTGELLHQIKLCILAKTEPIQADSSRSRQATLFPSSVHRIVPSEHINKYSCYSVALSHVRVGHWKFLTDAFGNLL